MTVIFPNSCLQISLQSPSPCS
ncbi:hypothetical protein Nmel_011196 [Mimus melanotis]